MKAATEHPSPSSFPKYSGGPPGRAAGAAPPRKVDAELNFVTARTTSGVPGRNRARGTDEIPTQYRRYTDVPFFAFAPHFKAFTNKGFARNTRRARLVLGFL